MKLQANYLLMRWARVRDDTLDYLAFLAEFPTLQTQIRHWLTLTVSSSRTAATCRLLLAVDANLWRFIVGPRSRTHQQQRPVFDFLRDALIAFRTG